jgi:Ca-activated chloride channel family protein
MLRLLAFVVAALATPATALECHTALVLALDASNSIDSQEHDLQRKGLADALRAADVQAAINPYPGQAIAAMAFEWSSPDQQITVAPWSILNNPAQIAQFANAIENGPALSPRQKTAIGSAIAFASSSFDQTPINCRRKLIDISGDGPGNAGPIPETIKAMGAQVINALVIRHPNLDSAQPPNTDPLVYYQKRVIRGPGAFVIVVNSYRDYPAAIRRKLLRELTPMVAQAERVTE